MVGDNTVYDCCLINDELDILELRLSILDRVVDWFVVVESNQTHSGHVKPFHVGEAMERFERWADKIIRIESVDGPTDGSPWLREIHQRNAIISGLREAKPTDWIMCSDADEIPNPESILLWDPNAGPHGFVERLSYYWINCVSPEPCGPTRIFTLEQLNTVGSATFIRREKTWPTLPGLGWHLSYTGGVNGIQAKLNAYSHQELNIPEFNTEAHISNAIQNGLDLFGRDDTVFTFVPIDHTFPEVVRNNPRKWAKFIAPV